MSAIECCSRTSEISCSRTCSCSYASRKKRRSSARSSGWRYFRLAPTAPINTTLSQPDPSVRICASVRFGLRRTEIASRAGKHQQSAQGVPREQVLQPAANEHADVEQLFLPHGKPDRRREREPREVDDRVQRRKGFGAHRAADVEGTHQGQVRDRSRDESGDDPSDAAAAPGLAKPAIVAGHDNHRQRDAEQQIDEHRTLHQPHGGQVRRWMVGEEPGHGVGMDDTHQLHDEPSGPHHEQRRGIEQPLHAAPERPWARRRGESAAEVVGHRHGPNREAQRGEVRDAFPANHVTTCVSEGIGRPADPH